MEYLLIFADLQLEYNNHSKQALQVKDLFVCQVEMPHSLMHIIKSLNSMMFCFYLFVNKILSLHSFFHSKLFELLLLVQLLCHVTLFLFYHRQYQLIFNKQIIASSKSSTINNCTTYHHRNSSCLFIILLFQEKTFIVKIIS